MEKMTFEKANEELEKSISKLEQGNMLLRDSVDEYTKACELLAFCLTELETCKGKIRDVDEMLDSIANGGEE